MVLSYVEISFELPLKDIRRAEKDTPEGRKILSELREECRDKYFPKNTESASDKDQSLADLEYGVEYPTSPHS